MRTVVAVAMVLALATVGGCRSSSPKGGVTTREQGFTIKVRRFTLGIKQGDVETTKVSLKRSDYFKKDVHLEIDVPAGLTIEPNDVLVKASDRPDVELRIAAEMHAALGKYRIAIRGTPASGQPTSEELIVEVKPR